MDTYEILQHDRVTEGDIYQQEMHGGVAMFSHWYEIIAWVSGTSGVQYIYVNRFIWMNSQGKGKNGETNRSELGNKTRSE